VPHPIADGAVVHCEPTPPFPFALDAAAARRQATVLLAVFYGLVYGAPFVLDGVSRRLLTPALSAFIVGTVMLLVALPCIRRDVSWRESLALHTQPLGHTACWSLLGFLGIYAVNLVLTLTYVAARGDVQAVASRRLDWLGVLAEVPLEMIAPLALFIGVWEETVFRGFLLGRLRVAIPAPPDRSSGRRRDALAVFLTALFFGLGHGYQGLLGILQTTLAGAVLGGLVLWKKSLWPTIGAHLLIDLFGLLAIQVLKTLLKAP
jgi:membrane protease YdiL (CAAX protease family)